MKNIKLFIFNFFFAPLWLGCMCILFMSGCVPAPYRRVPHPDISRYVNVVEFCNRNNLIWEWDVISQKFTIRSPEHEAVFFINSNTALINNQPTTLKLPLIYKSGALFISKDAVQVFLIPALVPSAVHRIRRIVIDAGHGGHDPGAVHFGIHEDDINLSIARHLEKELLSNGIEVIMTRKTDVFVPLSQRVRIANTSGADIFVSIHCNACRGRRRTRTRPKGFEVFSLGGPMDEESRLKEAVERGRLKYEGGISENVGLNIRALLWDIIQDENKIESKQLSQLIVSSLDRSLATPNRGSKTARFYVLKWTHIPSVLVEVGFLSNRWEASKLTNTHYQKMVAESIADGILRFKELYEKTDGFSRQASHRRF
ncbi:hypothetical protein B9J78_01760 [bacterium Unc6]|nr:hypothetical protein [bacterium Unc6]